MLAFFDDIRDLFLRLLSVSTKHVSQELEGSTPPPPSTPNPQLRRLVAYSISCGLCPLIPMPFVDDWALRRLKRHHAAELARRHGLNLDQSSLSILSGAETPSQSAGCAWGCFLGSILRSMGLIFRKLLGGFVRKVLFFLALRDCANTFSQSLHELVLLDHLFARGPQPGREVESRAAIDTVCLQVDSSGLAQLARGTLSSSRIVLSHASSGLAAKLLPLYRAARRGKPAHAEDIDDVEIRATAEIQPLIDQLTLEIAGRSEHLGRLTRLFDRSLDTIAGAKSKPDGT